MTELQTNPENKLGVTCPFSTSFQPIEVTEWTKKELTGHDINALYFTAMNFVQENAELFGLDYLEGSLFEFIYNHSSICDNSLCLNDFEGFDLSMGYYDVNLKSIELDVNNRYILNVYNPETDECTDYLLD